MAPADFQWLDPGPLRDGELSLVLVGRTPAEPAKDWVPAYNFGLRVDGHDEFAGHVNLRIGDTEHVVLHAGHVGYSVAEPFRGHRYSARATRLVLPLAARHGMRTVWITCDPDNHASRRILEVLGATYVETVDVPPRTEMYERGSRRKRRYRLDLAG